jgi:hypothetical protein
MSSLLAKLGALSNNGLHNGPVGAVMKPFAPISRNKYDQFINNVVLWLRFNSRTGFLTDSSQSNFNASNTNVTSNLSNFIEGDGSANFNGAGSLLQFPLDSAFDFGTGDFTIECWFNSRVATGQTLIARWTGTNTFFLGIGPNVSFYVNNILAASSANYTINTWNHVAASRNGESVRLFLNGVQAGSTYTIGTAALTASAVPLRIGRDGGGNGFFNGLMDNIRITKGIGRYSYNFDISSI